MLQPANVVQEMISDGLHIYSDHIFCIDQLTPHNQTLEKTKESTCQDMITIVNLFFTHKVSCILLYLSRLFLSMKTLRENYAL